MEVNKRNTETFKQSIDDLYTKIYKQFEVIEHQTQTIASLQLRLNSLEQQLILQKVKLTGLGPSVRE